MEKSGVFVCSAFFLYFKIMKSKTNDQRFKSLFKELEGSVYLALLRERVVMMMDITLNDIKKHPEAWENGFIHSSMYEQLNDIVQKHIGFNETI